MTMGFELNDPFTDDDAAPGVVDGQHESKDSPEADRKSFVAMCRELVALGAIEVRDHGMRAVFPAPQAVAAKSAAPGIVRVPLGGPREKETPLPKEPSFPTEANAPAEIVALHKHFASIVDGLGGG